MAGSGVRLLLRLAALLRRCDCEYGDCSICPLFVTYSYASPQVLWYCFLAFLVPRTSHRANRMSISLHFSQQRSRCALRPPLGPKSAKAIISPESQVIHITHRKLRLSSLNTTQAYNLQYKGVQRSAICLNSLHSSNPPVGRQPCPSDSRSLSCRALQRIDFFESNLRRCR
jgi:hypothetical protein